MQSRPSCHQSTRHASSLGCARPARRRPFRLCLSASRRSGGKRVAAASVGRHVPEALFALSEDPGPDFQGTSQPDQGLFDALEESSIAVPDCGTMPWWADAQLCEMSKRCGGACSAWWALGTRALFDGGMVVPGRPLSQCLGKPQVGGGPRPLSLQAPSPLKVRSREDVIPLLQARVTTSGSDLFFKDFVVSTRRVQDIPIARTVDESSTAEIDSLRSFRNP